MRRFFLKYSPGPGKVIYTCNPSTKEVEAEGSRARGQSELHRVVKVSMS
jgi:hypothetical protein